MGKNRKKKSETIGVISGVDVLKKTRPIQDIPFRTGTYVDKRKKEKKLIKINLTNGYNHAII